VERAVTLAALAWQQATLRALRDQLAARGRHEVTLAEALALLNAPPGTPVEALLRGLLDRKDDHP
jgi:hypothetical protein